MCTAFVGLLSCVHVFSLWQLLAKAAVPPPSSSGSGDMGYAGSAGLQNQYYASNNTPCGYICYGFGQFDGQGSGHDFSGNVRSLLHTFWHTHTSNLTCCYFQVPSRRHFYFVSLYRIGTPLSAGLTTLMAAAPTPTWTTASSKC